MGNCSKTLKKTNPDQNLDKFDYPHQNLDKFDYPHQNLGRFYPKIDNPDQVFKKKETPDKDLRKTAQSDTFNPFSSPSPAPAPEKLPVVRLYGSPANPATSYIRFALLYKPVTLLFAPSETPDFGFETPVIQYGSDVISGSSETILRYLDSKFPKPVLLGDWNVYNGRMQVVVLATMLQHKSLVWHLERMVRWGEDLASRGGKSRGDPVMGSARMEVKKYGRSYSQLLEVMLEHAQMEERIVFPVLEREDRGLTKSVNEEHARDLPLMNGIKEDIKTIIVLDSGSSSSRDALYSLASRIKSLQENCKQHFEEEERGILPLMEAAELTQGQQERLLEQCLDVMPSTHSHLLKFFMEGLLPHEAMLYLDLITRCTDKDRSGSIYRYLVEEDDGKRNAGKPTMALLLKGKASF